MRREPPLLRRQLLTWLLVPLTLLLIADAFVSYWITLDFSRRAYDRTLIEIAHEVALHLRVSAGRFEFDMPEPARRVLLSDPSDKIHFGITTADGTQIAGSPIRVRAAIKRGPRDEAVRRRSRKRIGSTSRNRSDPMQEAIARRRWYESQRPGEAQRLGARDAVERDRTASVADPGRRFSRLGRRRARLVTAATPAEGRGCTLFVRLESGRHCRSAR
jgi:hypothetical protein